MHGSNSLPVPQLKSSASSIADLAVLGIRLGRLYQSAPFRHWSTASAPVGGAINLSRRLRFRGRGFRLCAFCFVALYLRLLALRHRLLHFDFLASIVVANFVSRAAGDLHATVAINLEAVIADQRANASTLRLNRVERIYAGDLNFQLHARVFVEQIKCPLRCGIPIAVNGTCVAADPAQLGLKRTG